MKKINSVAYLTCGLLLLSSLGHTEPSIEQLRRQAQGYYRDGQYAQAATFYRRMAKLSPGNLDVMKEVMWGYWNMRDFDKAQESAHVVLKLHPGDTEAQNILNWAPRAANRDKMFELRDKAVKNYQAGRYEQAIEFYKQLSEIDPNDVSILKDWLWALWSADRYKEAGDIAARIIKLQPNDSITQDLLSKLPAAIARQKLQNARAAADLAQSRADIEGALKSYKELIRLDPKDPAPIQSLAWAYYKLQRYDEAQEMAQRLIDLRPNDPVSWNTMARMQEARDELQHAIESYEKSLKIDPKQLDVQTQLGKLYVRMRDLDRGIVALQRVQSTGQAAPAVYPLLAKALFYKERYAESADVWNEAFKKDRTHFEYRYYEAQARYYAGQAGGMKQMDELARVYQDEKAMRFLINEAAARGDYVTAQELMEKLVPDVRDDNLDKVMHLAGLYITMGQTDKCLKLLDKVHKVHPRYARALVMQGGLYREHQLFAEAIRTFQEALEVNPNYDVARLGLAESYFDTGHWADALREMATLRERDETNPYYLLRYARYLYETGEPEKSNKLLTEWANKNTQSSPVIVLLYHGLTPFKRDPRLAALGNYNVDVFDDQMKALRTEGYTPVTTEDVSEWVAGRRELPKKSVLITFDDGRLDALRYADPVLERYNLKATMFSTLANAEGARPIAYASWPQLLSFQQTGRWEIQSHGDLAHNLIRVDSVNMGLFLPNRKWLDTEQRLETPEEWRERVYNDLDISQKRIGSKTGNVPVAYAYPDGEYGQNQTNYPPAAIENLKLVKQFYKIAFVEDNFGFNDRTRDPIRLNRLEPDQHWTGQQLIENLQDQNGRAFIYSELLHQAMWRGRTREAYRWLTKLQEANVSERVLWGEEARIRYAAGDIQSGYELASRVLSYNPDHYEHMIETNLVKEGPAWNPGFVYAKDNRERESYSFEQQFQLPRMGNLNLYLIQGWARYLETGYTSLTDNAGGVGFEYKAGLFHELSGDAQYHDFSEPGKNAASGNLAWEAQWTDFVRTRIEGGHNTHYTARALGAHIEQNVGGAYLQAEDQGRWLARIRARYFHLTDHNDRRQYQVLLRKTLDSRDHIRFAYRFTYDDMNILSPFYYSPQALRLHEIGPELSYKLGERIQFSGSYRAGLGKETITDTQFIQDAQATLRLWLTSKLWVGPTYWYQKTPTYRQETYGVYLRYRFGTLQNMGVPLIKEKEDPLY